VRTAATAALAGKLPVAPGLLTYGMSLLGQIGGPPPFVVSGRPDPADEGPLLPLAGPWLFVTLVLLAHVAFATVAVVKILRNRRMRPSDRIRWIAGAALVPVLGSIAWYKVGRDIYFEPPR
jgi:hypothetical protein